MMNQPVADGIGDAPQAMLSMAPRWLAISVFVRSLRSSMTFSRYAARRQLVSDGQVVERLLREEVLDLSEGVCRLAAEKPPTKPGCSGSMTGSRSWAEL